MKVLSIDLPWSRSSGKYGFAWIDLSVPQKGVVTDVLPGTAGSVSEIFSTFAGRHGNFDVVLIDYPIGIGNSLTTGYRAVERAFGNSVFVTNGPNRIQGPRFQPGAAHVANGLINANLALRQLGNQRTIVVESFPQLSILPLIDFSLRRGLMINAVTKLAAHKRGNTSAITAAHQLVGAFRAWSRLSVKGPAVEGQPDAIDALLALLPALEILTPSEQVTSPPCWLHSAPPGLPAHPSTVRRSQKSAARALWMSPMVLRKIGHPGVRPDGILSLQLPGWPVPASAPRTL